MGVGGGQIPWKKLYVTLEWPLRAGRQRDKMDKHDRARHIGDCVTTTMVNGLMVMMVMVMIV